MPRMSAISLAVVGVMLVLVCVTQQKCFEDALTCKGPTVTLIASNWLGAFANVHVAKIIIEEKLGRCVEIVQLAEKEAIEALATTYSTKSAALLEIWPEGYKALLNEYVNEKKTVINAGLLRVIGRIGWYIPSFLVEDNPDLDIYRTYRLPAIGQMFATNSTAPMGRFLGAPPGYSTYDASIVDNLKLHLQVEIANPDDPENDILRKLDESVENRTPLIFYFWTPHQVFAKHSLVRVFLPDHSETCYSQYNQENNLVDCDYPIEYLQKFTSMGMAQDSDVYELIKNFQYTNDDQVSIIGKVAYQNKTLEETACEWLVNNTVVWERWAPSFKQQTESFPRWAIAIIVSFLSATSLLTVIIVVAVTISLAVTIWKRNREMYELSFI